MIFYSSVVNYTLDDNCENISYKSSGEFNIGLLAYIRIYKKFYLKPGIKYMHYKYKNNFSGEMEIFVLGDTKKIIIFKGNAQNLYQDSYTFNEIEIPIIASYSYHKNKSFTNQCRTDNKIRFLCKDENIRKYTCQQNG